MLIVLKSLRLLHFARKVGLATILQGCQQIDEAFS